MAPALSPGGHRKWTVAEQNRVKLFTRIVSTFDLVVVKVIWSRSVLVSQN